MELTARRREAGVIGLVALTPIHRALGLPEGPLTWEVIDRAVTERVAECGDLDWKRSMYHPQDPKWQHEAAKDLAAMGNSGGGWLVLGIADQDDRAHEVTGVQWDSSQEQRLRKIGANRVFPPLTGLEFTPITNPDASLTVACVRVPGHTTARYFITREDGAYLVPYRNGPDTEFHGPREAGMALLAYANGGLPDDHTPSIPTSAPPLTSLEKLKSWLFDPTLSLNVHDLVMDEVATVVEAIKGQPLTLDSLDGEALQTILTDHRDNLASLADLVVTGIWHDTKGAHDQVWVDALQRLVTAGSSRVRGPVQEVLLRARLYPALLILCCAGVAAVSRGREELLIRMCIEVTGTRADAGAIRQPGCQILHPWWVLDGDWINRLPRWQGGQWTYPASHLLTIDTRSFFSELLPDDDDFVEAFHGVEYRIGLLQQQTEARGYRAQPGEYVGELGWSYSRPSIPHAETAFRAAGKRHTDWPWTERLGGAAVYDDALVKHRAVLENYQYHRMR